MLFCANCGETLAKDSKFCEKCGCEIPNAEYSAGFTAPTGKTRPFNPVIGIVLCAVAVIIITVALFVNHLSKNPPEQGGETPATESSATESRPNRRARPNRPTPTATVHTTLSPATTAISESNRR